MAGFPDIGSVKIFFKTNLPGAGFSSSGIPKQGKVVVCGEFNITTTTGYTADGVTVNPKDIGLETIDILIPAPVSINDAATVSLDAQILHANYNSVGSKLVISTIGTAAAGTTAGQAAVVRFLAVGDTAAAPALV